MARRGVGAALLAVLWAGPAAADTLQQALQRAYVSNPSLTGQRAAQRATDENVPIARSQGLPAFALSASAIDNVLQATNNFFNPERQANARLQFTVPLYQGGAVKNAVRAAETRVDAGRAQLRGVEASTFTDVVAAYMNVYRDEAIVGLNRQNVRVLETNLQASRDRFQVGDLTRTDVAQSEARLAVARATLQQTEAQLIASRENYIAVVGIAPTVLDAPPVLLGLPPQVDGAVAEALASNPNLIAARRSADATRFDIETARANRKPRIAAVSTGDYVTYLGSIPQLATGGRSPNEIAAAQAGVQLTLPLFQGGRPAAQVRQAQALRGQALEAATATERQVIAQTRSAFAIWRSAQQVIQSSETAVSANRLSLEGVRAENSVGTRTVLDILDAEQELLNSQVTLVTARRDAYVAGFALLAAMGRAEAASLGLDPATLYDPAVYYKKVRGDVFDWGDAGNPVPIATTTAGTPAQGAAVTRPLDPHLQSQQVDRNQPLTTGAGAPDRQ